MATRKCERAGCEADVEHGDRHGAYCKNGHWNDESWDWWRPKCECGVDTVVKLNKNSFRFHSDWCPVAKWKRDKP